MKRVLLGLGGVAAAVTLGLLKTSDPSTGLARLPSENAAVLSIDFAALRSGGVLELLSGPVVEEEPEYNTFVEETGFDGRRGLERDVLDCAAGESARGAARGCLPQLQRGWSARRAISENDGGIARDSEARETDTGSGRPDRRAHGRCLPTAGHAGAVPVADRA